jgi:hypothetical protein
MKRLLFGAAITMIVISPALAGGGRDSDDQTCKGCPSWRSPASSDAPPVVGSAFAPAVARPAFPVCRLVKERIGTRRGRPVHKTWQLCG